MCVCVSTQQVHTECTWIARSRPAWRWSDESEGVEKDERSGGIKCTKRKRGYKQAERARGWHAPSATIHSKKRRKGEREEEKREDRRKEKG